MSFLEKQYELINKKSETLKDGEFPENGKLLGTFGLLVNTIPQFHHRFSLWTEYIDSDLHKLANSITDRCVQQCKQDQKMSYGKNVNFEAMCDNQCNYWGNQSQKHLEKSKREADVEFNKCLAIESKEEIEHKNVLACKKKVFMDYMEKIVNYEETLLNSALSRYV